MGIAMTVGTHGAVLAAPPDSTAVVLRQDFSGDSAIDMSGSDDLSNQSMKDEPDNDTNSGGD